MENSSPKYQVKDVMNKVNDLIDKSNSLGIDYKIKHNELMSLFQAFKVMSEWIEKHNESTSMDCAALIADLMTLIQEKSNLLKPEDEEELRRMKIKQKEIMNSFKTTGKGLSVVVTDLKGVLNEMERQENQNGGNYNQSGGNYNQSGGNSSSKLTKKNKNKYKYR